MKKEKKKLGLGNWVTAYEKEGTTRASLTSKQLHFISKRPEEMIEARAEW